MGFVFRYCAICSHKNCEFREIFEKDEIPKVLEEVLMEVGCRFFEVSVEGIKERIASWISAQPYATRFTTSQLLKELNTPCNGSMSDIDDILSFFVRQGWIGVDGDIIESGVDCLSGIRVYRVLLNKPIDRERLVQIRKAGLL